MNEVPHFHYERVSSTNDIAKELLALHERLFVSADYQFKGRGRKGRTWEGESYKNIYLSYAVNELKYKSIDNKALYQVIGSLAVKKILSKIIPQDKIKLKYPNDVYVANDTGEYRKISGILSEHGYLGNSCTETILGIGINVNQDKFDNALSNKATSLKLLGYSCDLDKLLEDLKENILHLLERDEKEVFDEWKEEIALVGKKVALIETGAEFVIERVNPDGSLLARNEHNERNINNGDSISYEL